MTVSEGIDFILDPMGASIRFELYEHIDGLQSVSPFSVRRWAIASFVRTKPAEELMVVALQLCIYNGYYTVGVFGRQGSTKKPLKQSGFEKQKAVVKVYLLK